MPSLFHTLNIGSEALYATRQGVDTTGHNIANAQTPGYSRQRLNLTQRTPLDVRNLIIGNGVLTQNITRAHDKFIEKQMNLANHQVGQSRAFHDSLKSVEAIFAPELEGSVSDEISNFFNSIQDLSSFPEDFTVRTSVFENAKSLCNAFKRVDGSLRDVRSGIDSQLVHMTESLTHNLKEIAALNVNIQSFEMGREETANDLRDQRDRLLREVSEKIDCHYFVDKFGMVVIRGPKEVTLVEGANASTIDIRREDSNDGMMDIVCTDWEGLTTRSIGEDIKGGELSGILKVRDEEIPNALAWNNQLASELAESFNQIHRQGFGVRDFNRQLGRDFFKLSADPSAVAAELDLNDVIYESVDAISTGSSALAPGDNVIANQLASLKENKILNDKQANFQEYYSNFIGSLGITVKRAEDAHQANELVVEDLSRRRESITGVSLDEEATNLLKWQTCFAANSKVITTVDEMLDTVLSLKR